MVEEEIHMLLTEYSNYDGLGLAELVRKKEVSPKELLQAAIQAIELVNPSLHAVHTLLSKEAEQEIDRLPDGPFTGVPFLIKEMALHAANIPSNYGSRLAEGMVVPYDTELMARFRKAGLVTVGTTTTPEFGYNATTESIFFGPTRNPWNPERSPGGSSGGSSAAIASGMVPLAHGNDGGGSLRIPASCCGLVGLKPTRGRIPTGPDYGELLSGLAIEFAITRTVRDTAALLDAVSGPDAGCYAWAERPGRPYAEDSLRPPGKLRIAWMEKPFSGAAIDPECKRVLQDTVKLCEEFGHEVVEASPQVNHELHALATLRFWTAGLANMMDGIAKYMNRTPSKDNLETSSWACYQYGKSMTATEYLEAVDIRTMISRAVGSFFEEYDVLLTPTLSQPPLPLGILNANAPGIDARQWTEQIFTYAPFTNICNTTGQPAISLPLGWSTDNMPIGMQFIGRFADEATLLQLAAQLEEARPWKIKRPSIHVQSCSQA
ncbi:amidase [Brevibacillus fluminis]|uniref:amidase n=1 Tax=Brevibacillus fluminis TaxID=511487 RepID=UPI003F89DFD6